MNMIEPILTNSHDHIMANTWRLIFERKSRRPIPPHTSINPDFTLLEELLTEYRLIGLCLAEDKKLRPN